MEAHRRPSPHMRRCCGRRRLSVFIQPGGPPSVGGRSASGNEVNDERKDLHYASETGFDILPWSLRDHGTAMSGPLKILLEDPQPPPVSDYSAIN